MTPARPTPSLPALARVAHPVVGHARDYDRLLELVGARRFVLIGEATHGSAEFYRERARITERLIDDLGFDAVLLEADWPDTSRVCRYLLDGSSDATDATAALAGFARFPAWMWRNTEMAAFVERLRHRNAERPTTRRVGVFGLDLYSLHRSIEAVIGYLDRVDPVEAQHARERYGCFDQMGSDESSYGAAVALQGALPCEDEVVAQLVALRRNADTYLGADGPTAHDEHFAAEMNALVVRDAEEYYHQMYRAEVSSWNLRDHHMANVLAAVAHHLDRQLGRRSRLVVWAHNSHVGDARATSMGARGEVSLGQLVRRHAADDCFLIGLTTFDGTVTAAPSWGGEATTWRLNPALASSHEALLHQVGLARFWVSTDEPVVHNELHVPRLERAVGVVYRPHTERQSHYLPARLAEQFDAVVHLDRTTALTPLDPHADWARDEPADTYPSGV